MNLFWHVCEVCATVKGDESVKACSYCPVCDAYICEACLHDYPARAAAAAIRLKERLVH